MGYDIFGRAAKDAYWDVFFSKDGDYRLYLVPNRAFNREFYTDMPAKLQEPIKDKQATPRYTPSK